MRTLKKILSLLLCGAVAAAASASVTGKNMTADAVSVSGSADGILDNTKNGYKTYIYWEYNRSATLSSGSVVAVYDVWGKYDTAKIDPSDPFAVSSPSSNYISSITCILDNGDGSYVSPKIVGFEPGQATSCTFYFQKNGVYNAYSHSTSGGQARSSIDVVEVVSPLDPGDKTAPVIKTEITSSTSYYASVNIETDELCSLTVNGKTYSECTGVDVNFTSNGIYTITATDVNGNTATRDITINSIGGTQQVTTEKPVVTTTKPATTVRTTTTARPVTTTERPVTTTERPVTTTERPVTTTERPITTTEKPVTTTERPVTTTERPITTTERPVTTTERPVTTTERPVTTTERPITTTERPITTTERPITTTERPITTTEKPVTTTERPITTTERPVTTAAPITTAKVTTTVPPASGSGIILPDSSQLKPGNTITLQYAAGTPQVYWLEPSDYSMVQISGNNITLQREGTVTITAHCADNVEIMVTFTIGGESDNVEMGDVDGNGKIDASDAAIVLQAYARLSTGRGSGLEDWQETAANVNGDNKIDASDAADILVYYSAVSTGRIPTWNKKN